ncbi:FRG domain-containing protein [Pseudoalteromonas sp. P1-25]|uniref:FRG domain-containing protein n=1 Tax=Pseudoalteromonas sp. P1-25 TaxID=1723758 RepID=UPI0006E5CEB3|nr:FRG domain-containing protein [Pseudoalteromonas sp. P1-25]KPZ57975.1 FRG domain protein [Pseudoalteromonas sp. P1-25]
MEEYDFSKVPLWDGTENSFEIIADKVNGRIPTTKLEHWEHFTALLESPFFNRPRTQVVYRGHRRFDWSLMPTLARVASNGIINEDLATNQLDIFKKAVRGRLSDNQLVLDGEEDELWSVGQHHGLLTPLLDWTFSPFVALFFAFSKEDSEDEQDNPYRAIYVLNKTFIADDSLCPDIRLIEPKKDDHGRLVNQAGLFTYSPYDSTIEAKLADTLSDEKFEDDELRNADENEQSRIIAKYICKIYIKNEDREGCLRHLRRMNVHHASLFPDLIGASEHCNLLIAEDQRQAEIDRAGSEAAKLKESSETLEVSQTKPSNIIYDLDRNEVDLFVSILTSVSDKPIEAGRIQVVSEKLASSFIELKSVDWHKRETILSQMRSKARVILRKFGVSSSIRDSVIDQIISIIVQREHTRSQDELSPNETSPKERSMEVEAI